MLGWTYNCVYCFSQHAVFTTNKWWNICFESGVHSSRPVTWAINPQWGESRLSLYNSNEQTFLLCRIKPICVASTSVSAILQTPWNTACRSWHDVPVLFQNPAWQAQTNMAVSLWVSWAKYQCRLWSSSWPFCSDSPEWHSRHMVTWFGHHGNAFGMT